MNGFHYRSFVSQRRCRWRAVGVIVTVSLSLPGCHDLTGNQTLPSGTQDPTFYNNATGALGMRNAAVFAFGNALVSDIVTTGLLTDELMDISAKTSSAGSVVQNGGTVVDPLDERLLPELPYGTNGSYDSDVTYNKLQGMRTALLQAIGQLATYDTSAKDTIVLKPAAGRALRGELYALYGYTEIMLADFFCSGIPLTTVDFQKDFTYRAGSTTSQVYLDAIGKLDTALALSGDSLRIQTLARIGLGRVYLDFGNIAAAADDVSGIPSDYQYQLTGYFGSNSGDDDNAINIGATVSNQEGGNGLPYVSSGDPRTADTTINVINTQGTGRTSGRYSADFPKVYRAAVLAGTNGFAPITVASGIEAQLISAEAALHTGDVTTWINILNQLRATAPLPAGGGFVPPDTLWDTLGVTGCTAAYNCDVDGVSEGTFVLPAGYNFAYAVQIQPVPPLIVSYCNQNSYYEPCYDGIVDTIKVYINPGQSSPLAPLPNSWTDSTRSAQVALLFKERAAWLYMTGHRQGDLRRLLRQYPQYWDESKAYPTGPYLGLGAGNYGDDVTAPIPPGEYINPLFHGCLSREP